MKHQSNLVGKEVFVIDGNRTPFLKARGVGPFSASDLAVAAGQPLLNRLPFSPEDLDEVIIGSAIPGPDEANIARVVALRLGCGHHVPAFTVMRNCASGMQAIDNAAMQIASGRSHLVLAGGTDAMSHSPLLLQKKMVEWFYKWSMAKNVRQKASALSQIKLAHIPPVIALKAGLTDPIVNLDMGQTAEKLAYRFAISREQMDQFAVQSHLRLAQAYQQGLMDEVTPIYDRKGQLYQQDDGYRTDANVEKLSTLKPYFDKKFGMVTAANSSQVTDGACLLVLASAEAVKKYNLPVLGKIVDSQWAAIDPSEMGLGPVHAATAIMQRHGLLAKDFATWEINEAFAAQVLACLAAWDDKDYCKTHFGTKDAIGAPPLESLNKSGGAIAAGHPIGASGARIVLHVLKDLERTGAKKGMAAICIGGGQGGAMYLERVAGVNGND